jgi:hypothetical protein
MEYGQELLNKINTMLGTAKVQDYVLNDNYNLKKDILENKGYTLHPVINHLDMTSKVYPVWVMTKANESYEFKCDKNYWTGEQEEETIIELDKNDFTLTVLETIKTENLIIEYILSNYKDKQETSYFKITTKDNKVFYKDMYCNYFNTKGIKGIKKLKEEVYDNIDEQEIYSNHINEMNTEIYHAL